MQQFPFRVVGVYFNSHSTSTSRFSLCALCGLCAIRPNLSVNDDLALVDDVYASLQALQ